MSHFAIYDLPLAAGQIALCPVPGASGDYAHDLAVTLNWTPALVISLTAQHEMDDCCADCLGADLIRQGSDWLHLPVPDFGVPEDFDWPALYAQVSRHLSNGRRVLVHCRGGCGRSGMIVLRLMIAAGEHPDIALARLREIRPCAVETDAQMDWALRGQGGN
jgi:protein-tyrosine phosphatase